MGNQGWGILMVAVWLRSFRERPAEGKYLEGTSGNPNL